MPHLSWRAKFLKPRVLYTQVTTRGVKEDQIPVSNAMFEREYLSKVEGLNIIPVTGFFGIS